MSEEKDKKKKRRGGGGGGGGIDPTCAEAIVIVIGIIIAMIFIPIYIINTVSKSNSKSNSNSSSNNEEDAKPLAEFVADKVVIDKGETVKFTFEGETGELPAKYQWNFGDGSSHSNEENPSHQFSHAGNYTVELTVTDNDGDSDSDTKTIRVKDSSDDEESSGSSESSESSNHRIPVYDPYYFLLSFIVLTAISFIIIKRKILNLKVL